MKTAIKEYRIKKNITQTELAELLGYKSSSIITMWESGERKPPADKLPKLSKILNCTVDDLLRGDEYDVNHL